MLALLPFLIFLFIMFVPLFIRSVPANTVVIIDRNTHYLKTKRFGFYFFNPFTDKVTTQVSTSKLTKNYINFFETNDGKIAHVSFLATYHAKSLDDVISSLASARRSIDDVLNSSVYWATNNLNAPDFTYNTDVLLKETYSKLLAEAMELNITIDNFNITHVSILSSAPVAVFKPHLNSHSSGPIKYR